MLMENFEENDIENRIRFNGVLSRYIILFH
eukprot:UN17973